MAAAALVLLGEDPQERGAGRAHRPPRPGPDGDGGRGGGPAPRVVVDYAHTPEAIRAALHALRPTTPGRLVCVTGAGGDRDRDKRHAMGAAAASAADLVVVTDDNPRSEDPASIRAAVLEGVESVRSSGRPVEVLVVGDRREAIRAAVGAVWGEGRSATVAVVGKGHERGQDVGGVVHPFDDREEVRASPSPRGGGGRRVIALTLTEVAHATGGSVEVPDGVDPDLLVVDGPVVTDSREAAPRGLYVARIGEQADGHDFVAGAVERGAVAALVSRPVPGVPCVVVADPQEAFGALAREVVRRLPGLEVVGITGSSGKTSTKDLLGSVLGTAGPTVAPVGSYNSEVGVPLTVCRVEADTRFLVVEMGARGIGHVAYLARIAPPRVGVVLNVGTAHVGEFGSREAIGRAKAELVESLPTHGLAVLNADDPVVRAMATVARSRVVLVGEAEDAGVRATDVSLDAGGRAVLHRPRPRGHPGGAARAGRAAPRGQRPRRPGRGHRARVCRSSRPVPHSSPRVR